MGSGDVLQARVVERQRSSWTNKHRNFSQPIERLIDVWNPNTPDLAAGMRATVAALQDLIARAAADGIRLRALGSGWSLSRVAAVNGWLVNTKPLNWLFDVSPQSLDPAFSGSPGSLLFAQCGASVAEINAFLARRQRSLKTSGASNGQTIAGALSTGTHGSAIDFGAIPEFVVGLHLVVGATRHVWLERASRPVAGPAFARQLGAEMLRDDALFDAALVSFGSFGFIHGVMIETEPIFLLEQLRERMAIDAALRAAMRTLDFRGLALPSPGERPYHFEFVVNPHDLPGGAYVRTMYKHPFVPQPQLEPQDTTEQEFGDDVPGFIGTLSDAVPALIPTLVNRLIGDRLSTGTLKRRTLGDTFDSSGTRGKTASMAMGLPLARAADALDTLLAVHSRRGPFAGVFAFRFVAKSRARLGFTRFDPTCIVELDGVASSRSSAFYREVWDALRAEGILLTLHWGKLNGFLDAASVRQTYGADVDAWLTARRRLLDPTVRAVFSNFFLERLGLAG